MFVEKHRIEELDEPVDVYNFQVEDYHTYFVGDCAVWVHNKNCTPENKQSLKEHLEGTADNTGAKPNGTINGRHEESHFLSELDIAGGDLTDNIQNRQAVFSSERLSKGRNKKSHSANERK